jgi:hypothetical protein
MTPPYRPRQFVWCRFPFFEEPLRPGPVEHVCYIADVRRVRGHAHTTAMGLFTTTVPWPSDRALPLGIIRVDEQEASRMGQRPFVLDARKIGFMPIRPDFFPRLETDGHGILGTASPRFQADVQNALVTLAGRPDLVVRLGPDAAN